MSQKTGEALVNDPSTSLAVLLDADPAEEPGVTLAGERELRRCGNEPVQAHLAGYRHRLTPDVGRCPNGIRSQESGVRRDLKRAVHRCEGNDPFCRTDLGESRRDRYPIHHRC